LFILEGGGRIANTSSDDVGFKLRQGQPLQGNPAKRIIIDDGSWGMEKGTPCVPVIERRTQGEG
jgi:hypothetical protein